MKSESTGLAKKVEELMGDYPRFLLADALYSLQGVLLKKSHYRERTERSEEEYKNHSVKEQFVMHLLHPWE
ncbi:unnamed protein product [Strongylus vulgaris]|uniref:Uncharacterized protein n=1 Tax=Strongylus vulgaris TaxID=40348 RepID=A0A3P7JA71_STRVU|nr:unnamed protein product [Strongylus vulgaris]